jgi:tetratricopeptide (TPR) repeat protein
LTLNSQHYYSTMRYKLCFIIFLSFTAKAQHATIRETDRPMPTYPFSDPDLVARPGRVYPYFRFDGFTDQSRIQNWKMVELENDYIRLAITPEIGGKVWEAYEKSQQYPFIFSTHAMKFRDISLRGAWTTGGLEFNFGDIGHATTASTPVDYFTRTNPDGSVSCFIGATEWASRTTWRIEIKLSPGNAYFTTNAWWYNNTPVEQEMYHWVNAGFKAAGNLEFVFAGTHYLGHGGEYGDWPVDSAGHRISFYEQNDFGSYKSYHVFGRPTGFYGGYWHQDNMGFGHISPYYEKLGKKVWVLGLSQEGERWENLLTDHEGLNVELQSGRLFSQAAPGSMFTPFKHVAFAPYATESWEECWFPVKQTRGMTNASRRGALNLRVEGEWLKIDWMALENQSDTLKVLSAGSPLLIRKLSLRPLEVFRDSVRWQGIPDQLVLKVGQDVITDDPGPALNRPLKSPENFDWQSEYGLLLRGKDLSNQKNYREAEIVLKQALEKDPNLVPALSAMAQICYRQGLYKKALEYAGRALSVNTYDGEANYFWGLSSEQAGNMADALDGYSVAALSPAFRQAAWLRIACLAVQRADWKEAEKVIGKCLDAYPHHEEAWNMLAMISRKKGDTGNALKYIDGQLELDPLDHFARFEKYLNSGSESDRKEFVGLIRQELPHETYIEMAIQYYQWNLTEEAVRMLELAPAHPMVQVWQAYLLDKMGEKEQSGRMLDRALAASPALVFPFRPEMIVVFDWADQQKPNWKWRYYKALILWQNNQDDEAKSLFASCGTEPDFMPFYLAKAELFRNETSLAEASLNMAYQLDRTNWRPGIKLARFYERENQKEKALGIALDNYKANPGNNVVGLQYAQMLRLNGRYADALFTLNHLNMLPAEGDVDAHTLFRETNILYALEFMKAGKWNKAALYLQKAETWPENLFSGEPYLPDNRMTRFFAAYCYEKSKDQQHVAASFDYIQKYKNPFGWTSPLGNRLTKRVCESDRNYTNIAETILSEPVEDRDTELLKQFRDVIR